MFAVRVARRWFEPDDKQNLNRVSALVDPAVGFPLEPGHKTCDWFLFVSNVFQSSTLSSLCRLNRFYLLHEILITLIPRGSGPVETEKHPVIDEPSQSDEAVLSAVCLWFYNLNLSSVLSQNSEIRRIETLRPGPGSALMFGFDIIFLCYFVFKPAA